MIRRLQISIGDTVALINQWPIMVAVTVVIAAAADWFIWYALQKAAKDKQAQHEAHIKELREVHAESVAILQKQVFLQQELIRSLTESAMSFVNSK